MITLVVLVRVHQWMNPVCHADIMSTMRMAVPVTTSLTIVHSRRDHLDVLEMKAQEETLVIKENVDQMVTMDEMGCQDLKDVKVKLDPPVNRDPVEKMPT